MGRVYIGLLHHPVLDRAGRVVTSSMTGLDLHDLARAGRTYGVGGLFVVHPSAPQRRFAQRVLDHFLGEDRLEIHPNRAEALEMVEVVPDIGHVLEAIERREGVRPLLVGTSAREREGALGYADFRRTLLGGAAPVLILFGTSWGLAPEIAGRADHWLAPIRGEIETGFNHLSVRSAAAIVLDRLLGAPEGGAR
ncbi:MAG: RNA methyltransferase [bacterium]|nr:RNA methyltransferase [bacterium]